jgi:anti-sigma B factor antagonist
VWLSLGIAATFVGFVLRGLLHLVAPILLRASIGPATLSPVSHEARSSLDLRIRTIDSVVVLVAGGELDALTAAQLADAINTSLWDTQTAAVVVDLLNLQFLASAGMTVLLEGQRTSNQLDKHFGVVADGPATSRPMKMIGLDQELNLHSTLEAALSST